MQNTFIPCLLLSALCLVLATIGSYGYKRYTGDGSLLKYSKVCWIVIGVVCLLCSVLLILGAVL